MLDYTSHRMNPRLFATIGYDSKITFTSLTKGIDSLAVNLKSLTN